MQIGDLAAASSTSVESIRYYEREGLLPAPPRSEGNYRLYDATQLERLGFIRRCRSLDMTQDEIRVLLRFKDAPDADCGDVNALLDGHIGHVAARIRELRQLEKQLKVLRQRCGAITSAAHCGILSGLSGDAGDEHRSPAELAAHSGHAGGRVGGTHTAVGGRPRAKISRRPAPVRRGR